MKVVVKKTAELAGIYAADCAAQALNAAISEGGSARIVLSTGASQFPFFEEIVKRDVDWTRVEMFHLDEYVGIAEDHPASFKKYLLERFANKVPLKAAHFVDGSGDVAANIARLTEELRAAPVDVGLIGIGENAHIAFNDPPADFESEDAYIVVDLDEKCKMQQVREGWFADADAVCKSAVSMTCSEIMKCKKIICLVPYAVKAKAIRATLTSDVTNLVPATLLKEHADCTVVCDEDSVSLVPEEILGRFA